MDDLPQVEVVERNQGTHKNRGGRRLLGKMHVRESGNKTKGTVVTGKD